MATARASRAASRPAPSRASRTAPARPQLRVVSDKESAGDPRLATVKLLMWATSVILILTFSAVVALHALHVQVQVEIDAVRAENAELETELIRHLAELTEHDSPEGLVDAAIAQGLVEASDVVMLSPPVDSMLAGPTAVDPFSGDAASGAG